MDISSGSSDLTGMDQVRRWAMQQKAYHEAEAALLGRVLDGTATQPEMVKAELECLCDSLKSPEQARRINHEINAQVVEVRAARRGRKRQ